MKHRQEGFVLLTVLTSTIFIMIIGVVSLQLISNNLRNAKNEQYRINAQFAADAGLDDAVRMLNLDGGWTGNGGQQTLYDATGVKTTYHSTVINGSEQYQKFIHVTAESFRNSSSTTPVFTRKFVVEMRGVTSGDYSVVTGVGGLEMTNSSKIVGGNVYVNGTISLSNSAQIGLSTNPVAVKVAHQSCPVPANATYPRVCNTGESDQPITLNNSAKIYGEVQATNQTDGNSMSLPGLVAGSPPPATMPVHDRSAQVSAVSSTLSGNFSCSSGNHSWPANYRITGNVTISNSCNVTVNGDVWIGGRLSMSNSSKMIVANGLLSSQPVVMIDGSSGASFSNSSVLQSNSSNTGFRIITYWSRAGCSPGCSNVTGSDLYNSRNDTTISLSNSSSGAQTEFYARWTKVDVNNAGNIGALVGQTIKLSNSGAVTFGTSVSGVGGVEAWVVKSYKRTF